MKSEEWKSYRTRFLVNAKQLNSTLSFVDHLGRQHRGRKGDYLVESSDGVISIAPRRIFEDIYVPMPQASQNIEALREEAMRSVRPTTRESEIDLQNFEALEIEEIASEGIEAEAIESEATTLCKTFAGRQPTDQTRGTPPAQDARTQRKLPQPCRDRRSPGSRLGLM
jgi:hypothetical protein